MVTDLFLGGRLFLFTVVSGGCTQCLLLTERQWGAGALPCHEVNMWLNLQSDDVFFGWRSYGG